MQVAFDRATIFNSASHLRDSECVNCVGVFDITIFGVLKADYWKKGSWAKRSQKWAAFVDELNKWGGTEEVEIVI